MSSSNIEHNGVNGTGTSCEGATPGRCSPAQQRGPGRHQTTTKKKWTKQLNKAVMECYYLSNPVDESGKPVRGYRRRMHNIWKERGLIDISEQI